MQKNAKIYVAGHKGLVGSGLVRALTQAGYTNLVMRTHSELDLTRQAETENFFVQEKPEYVFLAAGTVGGIMANKTYTAEFIYDNIMIATNVIHAAYKNNVRKLLNLGSSCIYPKKAPQPMKEEYLLTSGLEPTNEPYAVAKIAAIKLCRYYNQQYGTNYLSVMPTNLFGPNDNYDFVTSHVLPALIRKFHLARLLSEGKHDAICRDFDMRGNTDRFEAATCEESLLQWGIKKDKVTLWGSGEVYREFLHVDDLVEACLFLMEKYDAADIGELINIGTGKELTIKELAETIKKAVGFTGEIVWDTTYPDGSTKKLLDVSKLSGLGWNSSIGLAEGIQKVYASYTDGA